MVKTKKNTALYAFSIGFLIALLIGAFVVGGVLLFSNKTPYDKFSRICYETGGFLIQAEDKNLAVCDCSTEPLTLNIFDRYEDIRSINYEGCK